MSEHLHKIRGAVDEVLANGMPRISSEAKGRRVRADLLALEKMIRYIRQEIMKEMKTIKAEKQARKKARMGAINNIE